MEVRTYKIQRIERRNGQTQFYVNLPKKFLEDNKWPREVFVARAGGLLIICVNDEELIEALRKLVRKGSK